MESKELESILAKAPFGSQRPILSAHEAAIRAQLVFEDMMAIGFDLRIHAAPFYKKLWIPYYELPKSDFGVESGEEGIADALTAHGIGLNWGDLVRLSKACKIGAMLLPGKWPQKV